MSNQTPTSLPKNMHDGDKEAFIYSTDKFLAPEGRLFDNVVHPYLDTLGEHGTMNGFRV